MEWRGKKETKREDTSRVRENEKAGRGHGTFDVGAKQFRENMKLMKLRFLRARGSLGILRKECVCMRVCILCAYMRSYASVCLWRTD